jgi:hypothetical protein
VKSLEVIPLLYPSFNDDEDMVQDVSPQEVIEEVSKPHAFRSTSRSSHSPETWLELHQGLIFDVVIRPSIDRVYHLRTQIKELFFALVIPELTCLVVICHAEDLLIYMEAMTWLET